MCLDTFTEICLNLFCLVRCSFDSKCMILIYANSLLQGAGNIKEIYFNLQSVLIIDCC